VLPVRPDRLSWMRSPDRRERVDAGSGLDGTAVHIIHEVPVICSGCGHAFSHELDTSIILNSGDTVTVAAGALTARCPQCGATAVNRGSETGFVKESGLQMRPIALGPLLQRLVTLDVNVLLSLRAEAAAARSAGDAQRAEGVLTRLGFSNQDNRMELWTLLLVILAVVPVVLALRPPEHTLTPDQVDQLLQTVISQMKDPVPAPSEPPGTDSPDELPRIRDL
jgi:hypothetical protein